MCIRAQCTLNGIRIYIQYEEQYIIYGPVMSCVHDCPKEQAGRIGLFLTCRHLILNSSRAEDYCFQTSDRLWLRKDVEQTRLLEDQTFRSCHEYVLRFFFVSSDRRSDKLGVWASGAGSDPQGHNRRVRLGTSRFIGPFIDRFNWQMVANYRQRLSLGKASLELLGSLHTNSSDREVKWQKRGLVFRCSLVQTNALY
jgi:hypothetical protein